MIGYIHIEEPNYNKIIFKNTEKILDLINLKNFNFFHGDKVKLSTDHSTDMNIINVIDSPIINKLKKIVGILIIKSTVKYGSNKRNVPYYIFKPLDWRLPSFIVASKYSKRENIYVEINYHKWERKIPYGLIVNIIGPVGNIDSDNEVILSKYNLNFSTKDKRWKDIIIDDNNNNNNRHNFNTSMIFSIDPKGCRDIDDALHIKKLTNGNLEVGIHIADVSHFVKNESLIDNIAKERLMTIYAPHRIINMLPEDLSFNKCSLLEGQERYTMSVIINFSTTGIINSYNITPGIIKCNKNYSYEEVDEIIYKNKDELTELEKNVYNLFIFSNNLGTSNSHNMVEKFMIIANNLVCKYLIENPKIDNDKIIIRKHKSPKQKEELDKIPKELYSDIFYRYLNAAEYDIFNINDTHHFGLGLNYYTHFTSPIRRYSDIIVHRLLKANDLQSNDLQSNDLQSNDLQSNVTNLNDMTKRIKKAERNFNFIKVLNTIKKEELLCKNCDIIVDAWVLDWNIGTVLKIYIPQFKIEMNTILYHPKIHNLLRCLYNNDSLIIKKGKNEIKFKKYQKIQVKLIAKEKEGFLNKKIWADVINPVLLI